jgi:hypothetical protein
MTDRIDQKAQTQLARSDAWSPKLSFRYSTKQVLEFARFMDFLYERQVNHLGDLQKVVIVRSVCESALSHGRGCNTSSLSDSLMIPRETVRRKCKELARDGWLMHDGNEFQPGPSITQETLDLVDENIDRLNATADKVRKLER